MTAGRGGRACDRLVSPRGGGEERSSLPPRCEAGSGLTALPVAPGCDLILKISCARARSLSCRWRFAPLRSAQGAWWQAFRAVLSIWRFGNAGVSR